MFTNLITPPNIKNQNENWKPQLKAQIKKLNEMIETKNKITNLKKKHKSKN
jgi:hypothetical protein